MQMALQKEKKRFLALTLTFFVVFFFCYSQHLQFQVIEHVICVIKHRCAMNTIQNWFQFYVIKTSLQQINDMMERNRFHSMGFSYSLQLLLLLLLPTSISTNKTLMVLNQMSNVIVSTLENFFSSHYILLLHEMSSSTMPFGKK